MQCNIFTKKSESKSILYFAYGSNMFLPKLKKNPLSGQDICLLASFWKLGKIIGYKLSFNKKSKDCSMKANIIRTNSKNDVVEGVIFEIDQSEQQALNQSEGGYCPVEDIKIETINGPIFALTYVARSDKVSEPDNPYDWYKEYLFQGAKKYKLSNWYIKYLESIVVSPDPDEERGNKHKKFIKENREF